MNSNNFIQKQNISCLVICITILLAFYFIMIFPSTKTLKGLDKALENSISELIDYEKLSPIYADLLGKNKDNEDLSIVTDTEKTKLSIEDIEKIPDFIEEVASKHKFETISIISDIKSLNDESGFLLVDTIFKGSFFEFRDFLIMLVNLPYLDQISKIDIAGTTSVKKVFQLKLRLAVE